MKWSLGALTAEVPLAVVTVASSNAGARADRAWWRCTRLLIEVPTVEPKWTAVAPDKLVPLTVTEVPPAVGPLEGLTEVTVGTAGGAVGAPENSSRLALEADPSVKYSVSAPDIDEGGGAAQRGQRVRGTTGDRVDVARRHGHAVVGGRALGQDPEGRAGARRRSRSRPRRRCRRSRGPSGLCRPRWTGPRPRRQPLPWSHRCRRACRRCRR